MLQRKQNFSPLGSVMLTNVVFLSRSRLLVLGSYSSSWKVSGLGEICCVRVSIVMFFSISPGANLTRPDMLERGRFVRQLTVEEFSRP